MKGEIISSSVVRITGAPPTGARTRALEPFSRGSMLWEVPPDRVKVIGDLVPPPLLALAARKPVECTEHAVCVPKTLWHSLYPYQQDGVRRIVHQYKGRCLLADEMGLGKTRQALAVVAHYSCKTLVICPSFLQTTWRRELEVHGSQATVCSYGTVPACSDAWDLVVVDEAHYLKSVDSCRTQAILPLLLAAPHVLLISGTPCPNRPEELYSLLHAIRPKLVPSFAQFASRYCRPRRTAFCAYDTRGSDREEELKWLLHRAFWVRRTKAEVLADLPSKSTEVLYVDADAAQRTELAKLQDEMQAALSRGSKVAQTLMSEMYRLTARAKMVAAAELVSGVLPTNQAVVIFAHHQCVLDTMQQSLPAETMCGRIDGRTTMCARQRIVDQFQAGELQVVLLGMGSAGVGLTLTRAHTAYFLEIPWCPAVLRQCEDRIHRIGQQFQCNVYYVLAHGTLDAYVWNTIHKKEKVGARIGQ